MAVIVLLNHRYLPDLRGGNFGFGVMCTAIDVVDRLARESRLGGIVLYRRNEGLAAPVLRKERFLDFDCVVVEFHYAMDKAALKAAFATVFAQVSGEPEETVIYHQSGALLPYMPEAFRHLVTHHGPFVSEVVAAFGREMAEACFRLRGAALDGLHAVQEAGIAALCANPLAVSFEISSVQSRFLASRQVPAGRLLMAPPPIACRGEAPGLEAGMPSDVRGFLTRHGERILIFSCAARNDGFKNMALFLKAGLTLMEDSERFFLLICVDGGATERENDALRARVPRHLAHRVLIRSRLRQMELLFLFTAVRRRGIFLFTSRYETLGITPLQAMASGVTVLCPDLPERIGMAEYVQDRFRFAYDAEGIVAAVQTVLHMQELPETGLQQRAYLENRIGTERFYTSMFSALEKRETC